MSVGIVPLFVKNMKDGNAYRASFTVMFEELTRKIYGDRLSKLNALVQRDEPVSYTHLDVYKRQVFKYQRQSSEKYGYSSFPILFSGSSAGGF